MQIDKASLLAKAVERVRDLKQRMAGIGEAAPAHLFPTEHDEIVVLASAAAASAARRRGGGVRGLRLLRRPLRPPPELIETLRASASARSRRDGHPRRPRPQRARPGARCRRRWRGRRRRRRPRGYSAVSNDGGDFLKEALRALVERPGAAAGDRPKRRRVVSDMNMQAAA